MEIGLLILYHKSAVISQDLSLSKSIIEQHHGVSQSCLPGHRPNKIPEIYLK